MKLENESVKVEYGVRNGASYWLKARVKVRPYRKATKFWAFANERAATAAAKRIIGGVVTKRLTIVRFEDDK